jgi:hypothetical protein
VAISSGVVILAHGFAFQHGIGDLANQQLDRADGIVVGGDYIINAGRVAVGVDQAMTGISSLLASCTAVVSRQHRR